MDLYSLMCGSDRGRALEWYEVFSGRPADEVVEEEHLWQVGENAWVVVDQIGRAGGSMITLGATDIDDISARLAAHGIEHEPVRT